jgi:DNA-binding transcriptional regulator LsrR (DeoR family)
MEYTFTTWERRRRHLAPAADRVLPLIVAAGQAGITRRELGHALDLERDTVDGLLAGLAGVGLITVTWEGAPVYRSISASGSLGRQPK